jgi:glycolate oxidase
MAEITELQRRLSPGALVTDPAVVEGYRRDRADIVPAGVPMAVVRAAGLDDVRTTLGWATEHRVPVVPRGAGTGLSGGANAIDGCVVLSLERMRRIREINTEQRYAVVEPGVINADLGRAAMKAGLYYPPDPGSFEICTIGGNLATNAGGMACVKYGVTRESAMGLEIVLAGGAVLHTGTGASKDVAGYDLTSLFIGSEGTLGVITAATLRLRPVPPVPPVTFAATFDSLTAMGEAVDAIAACGVVPSLLEFVDNVTINAIEDYQRMDLDRTAAGLLIGRSDGAAAEQDVEQMMACCAKAGTNLVVRSSTADESAMLLAARRLAGTAVMAKGPTVIEDVAVPPGLLRPMLVKITETSRASGIPIATIAHAGDGNLHPVLLLPDLDPATVRRALDVGEQLCAHARALGGTITGEHGVGLEKLNPMCVQFSPAERAAFAAVKEAFDPARLLNPGKLIPSLARCAEYGRMRVHQGALPHAELPRF